jgi:hypothetical protein
MYSTVASIKRFLIINNLLKIKMFYNRGYYYPCSILEGQSTPRSINPRCSSFMGFRRQNFTQASLRVKT